MKDVRFEPKVALVGGDRGTELYERFVADPHGLSRRETASRSARWAGDAQAECVGEADERAWPSWFEQKRTLREDRGCL